MSFLGLENRQFNEYPVHIHQSTRQSTTVIILQGKQMQRHSNEKNMGDKILH